MNINIRKSLVFSFIVLFSLMKAGDKRVPLSNNNLHNSQFFPYATISNGTNIILNYSPNKNYNKTIPLPNGQEVTIYSDSRADLKKRLQRFKENQEKMNKNKKNKENIFSKKKIISLFFKNIEK